MKFLALGLTALASTVALPASAAVVVSFAPAAGVAAGYTVVDDFESYPDGLSISNGTGEARVFSDSVSNVAARPAFGSTGKFGAVLGGGAATFYGFEYNPAGGVRSFGFVLGSLDTYNALRLEFTDGTFQDYFGGQIINDLSFPSGNQIVGETNGFVSYRSTGPLISRVTFSSGQNSFEFDNIAAGVPEPATWALMILGFGAVGGAMRRRQAVAAKVRFA